MISWLRRCAVEGEDRLRYSPQVRRWLSGLQLLRAGRGAAQDNQTLARRVRALCTAVRLAADPDTVRTGMARINRHLRALDPARIEWSEFEADDTRHIGKAAVLKPYVSEREKGVLFISFESEWVKLLRHGVLRDVARRYALVLAPSGSPHNLISYVFPAAVADPVFTLISHAEEQHLFPRVAANYVVVPLYASSWVNPDLFRPLPRHRRDLDLVMVANFAKFKRHFALFKALRSMPPRLRVLLIGQDEGGRNGDTILATARHYGVADRFTLVRDAPWQVVADALCRARASVILSRREGSCVVVAESLFADTPVALLRGAEVGSRGFINAQTGRLLRDGNLGGQLAAFIAESDRYAPRRWAVENISCHASSRALNDAVRRHLTAAGQEWTRDLAPLCWRPDPCLVRPEDRAVMRAEREDFRARFGLGLGPSDLDGF
jgi:glycosyltransferase involved in cell wall biosynthesis